MKTFGELEVDDTVYFIPNSLDYIDRYKIKGITNHEQDFILISVDYEYGFICLKNESISTAIDGAYFTCEDAAERWLSQKFIEEDFRHSYHIKLIQGIREQCKRITQNYENT